MIKEDKELMVSPPSFQQFDYRVRRNKSAERRMLSEAFRCLSFFEPIENYRYIGFGSTTFADFTLFHKALNIKDMISIEKRKEFENRFEFNKPFHCVQMEYGDSNEVLPNLSWDKRTIVWLDYDGRLTGSVLKDVAFISQQAISGNVLIITVNAEGYRHNPKMSYKKAEKIMLDKFRKTIDRAALPEDMQGKNFQGDEMAKTCRRMVFDEIKNALRGRNGLSSPENKMKFKSLFNFVYKDGARMLTVGGIFHKFSDEETLSKCRFESLKDILGDNEELVEIKVPVMTPRECHYLNSRLPKGACDEAEGIGLSKDEIADYVRFYRYSPLFAEIELS